MTKSASVRRIHNGYLVSFYDETAGGHDEFGPLGGQQKEIYCGTPEEVATTIMTVIGE